MTKTQEISRALVELSCSPVKADQTAIKRIENTLGFGVDEVVGHLDTIELVERSFYEQQERKSIPKPGQSGRIVACGLIGGSLSGLIFLASASSQIPSAIALGFVGGAALAKIAEH